MSDAQLLPAPAAGCVHGVHGMASCGCRRVARGKAARAGRVGPADRGCVTSWRGNTGAVF